MPDQWNSAGEEREILRLLAKSALNDYPNPERRGCPGAEFLHKLAFDRKSIPLSDLRLDHVVHCSPCFRELTQFRADAKARRNRIWAAVAAAAAIIGIGLGLWASGIFVGLASSHLNTAPIIAQIDLENRSITRGAATPSQQNQPIVLARGELKLTILLPFGSEEGAYDLEILKEVDKPLVKATGEAAIINGITKLNVSVNTSSLPPGSYLLGIRHPPLDWSFNPIRLR